MVWGFLGYNNSRNTSRSRANAQEERGRQVEEGISNLLGTQQPNDSVSWCKRGTWGGGCSTQTQSSDFAPIITMYARTWKHICSVRNKPTKQMAISHPKTHECPETRHAEAWHAHAHRLMCLWWLRRQTWRRRAQRAPGSRWGSTGYLQAHPHAEAQHAQTSGSGTFQQERDSPVAMAQ